MNPNRTATTRIISAAAGAALAGLATATAETGLTIPRTEHLNGDVTNDIVQPGGIMEVRVSGAATAISFWAKWDRGSDSSTKDSVDRGNNRLVTFRQVGEYDRWAGITRDEILPPDEQWHYHLFRFIDHGSSMQVSHYVDGSQTPTANRGDGPLGEFYFILGADLRLAGGDGTDEANQQVRSTDVNLIIDDIAVWNTDDTSVLNTFALVSDFGMAVFDPSDSRLTAYYDCESPQRVPLYSENYAARTPLGSTPSSTWYDFALPDGGVPLQDAGGIRRKKVRVRVNSAFGQALVSPAAGETLLNYDSTNEKFIEFEAPTYIYLDQYGRELGSSNDPNRASFVNRAFYRARNDGYAVRQGGRTDTAGTDNYFSQPQTDHVDLTWNWELEYAVIIDSATSAYESLTDSLGNPTISEDGAELAITTGRQWVPAGTSVKAAIDGVIFAEGEGAGADVSFRSTGYTIENVADDPAGARYLTLSDGSDHLRAKEAGISFGASKSFTLDFWARRDASDVGTGGAIVGLGSAGMWVGYNFADELVFQSNLDGGSVIRLDTIDLGREWHHWAWNFDEATSEMRVFIDGVEAITRVDINPADFDFSALDSIAIGGRLSPGDEVFNLPFAGDVDQFRLWSRALSADEISASMATAAYGPQPDLAVELTFDNADDVVETSNAARFGNDTSRMLMGSNSATRLVLPDECTVEALIHFPIDVDQTPAAGFHAPFDLYGDGLVLSLPIAISVSDQPEFSLTAGDLVSIGEDVAATGFNVAGLEEGWHRFSAAIRGGEIQHFVDGVDVGTVTMPLGRRLDTIGGFGVGVGTQVGWLDDARVWTKARTAAEIAADWSLPLEGSLEGLRAYYTFDDPDNPGANVLGTGHDGSLSQATIGNPIGIPVGAPVIASTEGSDTPFFVDGMESLFAGSHTVDPEDIAAVRDVVFPYSEPSPLSTTVRVTTDTHVVDDWMRITWNWKRNFRLQVAVSDNRFAGLPFIQTERRTYVGTDSMRNVWVPELSAVTVGTVYRAADRCFTLDAENGVGGQTGAFRAVTVDSVVDGTLGGQVTRQFSFPAITDAGLLSFTFSDTVFRAEVAIGSGIDATTAEAADATLVPDLCGVSPLLSPRGPSDVLPPQPPEGGLTSGDPWVWDATGRVFYPLMPGVFALTWEDANDPTITYNIEVNAQFPNDLTTIPNRENEDGSRQGSPSDDYGVEVTFAPVTDAFPASPDAHYQYRYLTPSPDQAPPVALDPSDHDRWYFHRTAFAEDAGLVTDDTAETFTSSVDGRAVMLFSYRPDPAQAANGDTAVEVFAPRVVQSAQVQDEELQGELDLSPPVPDTGEFQPASLWLGREAELYAQPNASGGNFSLGSDVGRTWESWVWLDGGDPDSDPAADRVILEIEQTVRSGLFQFGVRSPSHPTNPGGFFVSHQPSGAAADSYALELVGVVPDPDWHHWAVVVGSDGLRVYRDGAVVGEDPVNPVPYTYQASGNLHRYGYSPAEPGSWVDGGLDNIRFWLEALDAEGVRKAMRAQPDGTGAIPSFSYSMDRGASGSAVARDDDLGYAAVTNLTIRGATGDPFTPAADALDDDGSDSYPEVATRILTKLDTADYRSGFVVNELSNYNAQIYSRTAGSGLWGPVYPVNWSGLYTGPTALQLVYYENPSLATPAVPAPLHPDVAWPYVAVGYDAIDFPVYGEHKDKRVYIASRIGTEGVDLNANPQPVFDPATTANLTIYNQPDRFATGYNPNEEHALVAPSIYGQLVGNPSLNLGQDAAFALQDGLNRTARVPATYTSHPWVLVQYDDLVTGEAAMAAYRVEQTREGGGTPSDRFPQLDPETNLPTDALGQPVPQPADPTYDFRYPSFAGDLVAAPYPVNRAVGNVVMEEDVGADSNSIGGGAFQRTVWFDKNGNPWVVSGDSSYVYRFWYPMREDFWAELPGVTAEVGDPIAFLPDSWSYLATGDTGSAIPVTVAYDTYWKTGYPVLKRAESITYVGGENKADHPLDAGLPGVVGWQSAQVVFDPRTPSMEFEALEDLDTYTARVIRPLDRYQVEFEQALFSGLTDADGEPLTPASKDRVQVVGSRWYFRELTGSLQKRFYFDTLIGELVLRGRLNNLEGGDPDLTSTPISLSILETNVLDEDESTAMKDLGNGNSEWEEAVEELFVLSRNPEGIRVDTVGKPVTVEGGTAGDNPVDLDPGAYLAGVAVGQFEQETAQLVGGNWAFTSHSESNTFVPLDSLGTGAAVVPNPTLLAEQTTEPLYLTLVENNHPDASGAVALHIVRIGEDRFRGAIKVVEAQNVFDEKINLRHSADFGGNTGETYYQWWVRDVTSLDDVLLPGEEPAWQLYDQGLGLNQIEFSGRPDVMVADKLFYLRYGEKEELDEIAGNDTSTSSVAEDSWRLVDPNSFTDSFSKEDEPEEVPFQWAGAFNSPQLQADGSVRFIPQLVMGWVKRVLDRVNPYEARFSETFSGDAPATFSSMIQQAGKPFVGAVALNSDRDVLENVGLIELYETVLVRARELTLEVPGVADAGTNQALLLAATRLAVLYELLASEAYADAMNPSLPVADASELAAANPFTYAFQNQVASLLQEEMALLRGTDFLKAYPAYNRLFWNYVKGLGEAAYNVNYAITDITEDGIINESDAATLYPQGHGDAWGHYLSAGKMHYALLRHPAFDWAAAPELYSLLDNVIPADYLDEKSFARTAAAKARAGDQIVSGTYRLAYTDDPDGQWQGYTDAADPARAWGVSEWSKRAGQGALFDWMVGNALTPAVAEAGDEDLDRIDRVATQLELGEVAGSLRSVQETLDQANSGTNPLGLNADALSFDINPLELTGNPSKRRSHFEQIWERATAAARNALTGLEVASRADLQLRRSAEDTRELQIDALRQDYDYRNRLIEIYGRPYDGTVGPGQIYAEGYDGPDTLLYLYIDRTDPSGLKPTKAPGYTTISDGLGALSTGWSAIDDGLTPRFPAGVFDPQNVKSLFDEFYLNEEFGELLIGQDGGEQEPGADYITIKAPVVETADYAFQVPDEDADGTPDWGKRAAHGEIQILLNEILAAQIEMELEVEAYNDYVKDITILRHRVRRTLQTLQAKLVSRNTADATLPLLEDLILASDTYIEYIESLEKSFWRRAQVLVSSLPGIAGLAVDPSAPLRGSVQGQAAVVSEVQEAVKTAAEVSKFSLENTVKVLDRLADSDKERYEDYAELLELLSEFGAELNEEGLKRNRITSKLQQLEVITGKLSGLLAEGERLQNERAAFNMVLASKAQRNRYGDMVTRVTRNDVLGRYQNSLQHALRYAWLAAKAYDFETSLDEGSPAAATSLYERIVKTRQLGRWSGGEPQAGNGGLAEVLAHMKTNFEVLRGQLGINNPQRETGQLSLRGEHFRILSGTPSSDTRWRQALEGARVDDLWSVPEFRRYCRPFAPRSDGAQPGLVLEFATSINPGENVFGRPLAGGDNAYSSANYSTKISAVGAWFEGYNETSLSTTPRVYLVPVGDDILRVADAAEPTVRSWDVLEQRIPVPYVLNTEQLTRPGFIPSLESTDGRFDEVRRLADFRAYHTSGGNEFDTSQLTTDSRLIGRSVWNTRWLLIIPGATLSAQADAGLDAFVGGVSDIKLFFETYANPGS